MIFLNNFVLMMSIDHYYHVILIITHVLNLLLE